MEKKSPPLPPASKFRFFYFLPKPVTSSKSSPRTPSPKPQKKIRKKIATSAFIPRSASTRVKINRSFRFKEPKSLNVSCTGSIVNKGNNKGKKKERRRNNYRKGKEHRNSVDASRSNQSLILKLLKVFKKKEKKLTNPYAYEKSAPELGNAKKFLEWRVHDSSTIAPDRPSSLSNKRKEKRNGAVVVEDMVLVPRKEINLWKKRMVAPPPPLVV